MSLKAMVFIDGGWLYRSRTALFEKLGEENGFEIDYAKLPKVICEDLANHLDEDISLVRTNYFGTIPSSRSGFNTSKQYSFYDFLERACGYETDIHEVEVGTGAERSDDLWTKMALVSSLLYYAAIPGAYEVAIVIGDDPELAAAIRRVRLLGKRVQIVGVRQSKGTKTETLFSHTRVCDFPPIFLDDHAADVRLVRERRVRICKQCGAEEETTWAGPDFFCSNCRGRYRN
jgi:hypothetical protein